MASYTIEDGALELPFLVPGQYFRIVGSALNDGVYRYPAYGLQDETFDGAVWGMRVPLAVLTIAAEIDAFNASASGSVSPYTSESFGGYSYTRATDSNGVAAGWETQFATRLNPWRKLP